MNKNMIAVCGLLVAGCDGQPAAPSHTSAEGADATSSAPASASPTSATTTTATATSVSTSTAPTSTPTGTTGPSASSTATSTVDAHSPGAGLGKPCGGVGGIACGQGLVCEIKATHPDAMGKCVTAPAPSASASAPPGKRKAKSGEMCGGIAGIQCEQGLACIMKGAPHPDQSGTCSKGSAK